MTPMRRILMATAAMPPWLVIEKEETQDETIARWVAEDMLEMIDRGKMAKSPKRVVRP